MALFSVNRRICRIELIGIVTAVWMSVLTWLVWCANTELTRRGKWIEESGKTTEMLVEEILKKHTDE